MQVFICPTDETFLDRAYGRAFTQTLAFVNITYLTLCKYSTMVRTIPGRSHPASSAATSAPGLNRCASILGLNARVGCLGRRSSALTCRIRRACCMLHCAICMLHVVCCVLHVARCRSSSASTCRAATQCCGSSSRLAFHWFYGRIPAGANAHLAHSVPGLTCDRQHHIRPHMKFSLYVAFSACCRAFVLQGVSRHGMRHARAHVRETYRRRRHCALYGE
jgi:hypothetical protein